MRCFTALAIAVALLPLPALAASITAGATNAVQSPADSLIIGRPGMDRARLPDYMPKNLPGFELPPAEKILPIQPQSPVKIELKGIKFTGNTVISTEALQKIARPLMGKSVSIAELEGLRQQISLYYSQQGYVNSGAVLPEQHFQDGIINIQIIEGTLTEIRVKGSERLRPSYVSKRLYDEGNQILNINPLRQNFQQLLLDPLIGRMNGSLIPGSQRGTSILEVDVTRARPYQLNLSADNYTPPSIGGEKGQLSGWVRNLTGFGDAVDAAVVYGDGLLGGSGSFSVPLNAYDTLFNFHFNLNNAAIVEQSLNSLNIKSEYENFGFGLTQPLIKALNRHLDVGLVFDVKKNTTSLLGKPFDFSEGANAGVSKDSVLRFSIDFTERQEHQVFSARSTTSVGINAFAPTWYQYSSKPDGDFVAWLGQAQYAGQVFDTDAKLILRGDLQYTGDKLLTLERFALGGRYSVRGYRQNELVRDNGYVFSAELRYPLLKDDGEKTFPGQLSVFPFMDYGSGWNTGDSAHAGYLHSLGIGLDWQLFKQANTEIIYAYALNTAAKKADYNLQDSGVMWRVSISAF